MKQRRWNSVLLIAACVAGFSMNSLAKDAYLSPTALAATKDGKTLFIACATANQVAQFDIGANKILQTIALPEPPLGLALSSDQARLYAVCSAPESTVCVINTASGKITGKLPAGHTAMAPVLSPNGKTLYVCNRFNNDVSEIDLASGKQTRRIKVAREPVAADITPNGKYLLVANHLQNGPADADVVAAVVSVIDTASGKVVKEIRLANGCGLLRDIRISPDGRYACVTHLLSRFHLPTTQLERGWVETNAISLIDLLDLTLINTVLLDNVDSGAANPWATAWTSDGKKICVTHAGTHELSIVDFPGLLAKLDTLAKATNGAVPADYIGASRTLADVPNDLAFLVGIRQRVKLNPWPSLLPPETKENASLARGPRGLTIVGSKAYLANYFSDNLSVVDLSSQNPTAATVALGPAKSMTSMRRGEMLFNDAGLCFQGWLSCGSCHSSDARVDALNWDLLNDGIGNPKNAKSLLLSFKTPPTTSMGVRENASISVRSGIRHILFTVQPEEIALAIDDYLISLKAAPSPNLVKGKLSAPAERGKKLFQDKATACATCHKTSNYTDLQAYDVGTCGKFDKPGEKYDTPTLLENWRTGPFLHDGSAASMREVLTIKNPKDRHGKTSHLTPEQIDDLAAYVLSL